MSITKITKFRLTSLTALLSICLLVLFLPFSPIARLKSVGGISPAAAAEKKNSATKAMIQENYGKLPLSFEANRGQTDKSVKFLSRGQGYTFYLTATEAVMELRRAGSESRVVTSMGNAQNSVDPQSQPRAPQSATLRMKLIGANQTPRIAGAETMRVDASGNLVLQTKAGEVRQLKPVVYQEVNGARQEVASRYVINKNNIRFEVSAYDRSRPLVIDPVVSYAIYLGAIGNGEAITVDAAGCAYVTGHSRVGFPTTPGALKRRMSIRPRMSATATLSI